MTLTKLSHVTPAGRSRAPRVAACGSIADENIQYAGKSEKARRATSPTVFAAATPGRRGRARRVWPAGAAVGVSTTAALTAPPP